MTKRMTKLIAKIAVLLAVGLLVPTAGVKAMTMIPGVTGPTFNLTARDGYIDLPTGDIVYMWGYGLSANTNMQYPGPTLIVNQGDMVTVTLNNELEEPVSIIFPGQENVLATGGLMGEITHEAVNGGGAVSYRFVASRPGTFIYHSGTNPQLQIEMGLFGALIVRPAVPMHAYEHMDSMYDHEVLFLESEVDPLIHELVVTGHKDMVDFTKYFPVMWFINGRASPDTMAPENAPWLPNQPYNCMPMMHPGEKLLLRIINAGRDYHPFHTHGNHMKIIAEDGLLLESGPGLGADLSFMDFTHSVPPGGTADAIFTWTGEKLGWDIYGHAPTDAMEPNEYAPDHGKPIPVVLSVLKDISYGPHYSGSPFLGQFGYIPPGDCRSNLNGGYFYMWHSHKEKEMTTNDVFPGGLMTMLLIEHPSVAIGMMGAPLTCR